MTDTKRPDPKDTESGGERIAKFLARAGLCSRREAERWIEAGRVTVNGEKLTTPAFKVSNRDRVVVDGKVVGTPEPTRLWRYYKPTDLVTSNSDPEGRKTVFDNLPDTLPRVMSVGRLDINSEGLLLLTNDGALSRHLELPTTGWLRRYRVRAWGRMSQQKLDTLKDGVRIDGVLYTVDEARLERQQGDNFWANISLREGKNREIRRLMEHLDSKVSRLIRTSYGPFQLGNLNPGEVEVVPTRVLREQLGAKHKEFQLPSSENQSGRANRAQSADGRRPRPKSKSKPTNRKRSRK